MDGFVSFFREGGPFMYAILAVGVLALALVGERALCLRAATRWNARKLLDDLVHLAERGDHSGASALALRAEVPVAKIARAMLAERANPSGTSEERLRLVADEAAVLTLPPLARRLPHLSLLANVATLLGLLGTIFGLTTAFSAVNAADPSQRSAFLALGIAQALNTTAFGLIVAVPALLAHGWLVGQVEGLVEQVDEASIRLLRALTRNTESARVDGRRTAGAER